MFDWIQGLFARRLLNYWRSRSGRRSSFVKCRAGTLREQYDESQEPWQCCQISFEHRPAIQMLKLFVEEEQNNENCLKFLQRKVTVELLILYVKFLFSAMERAREICINYVGDYVIFVSARLSIFELARTAT